MGTAEQAMDRDYELFCHGKLGDPYPCCITFVIQSRSIGPSHWAAGC